MAIAKTYKDLCGGIAQSAKNQRDKAQKAIEIGLEHYKQHGDTCYLTYFIQTCVGTKSMPTKSLTDYIKAHANVSYGKLQDDSKGFKKASKGVDVTMPEQVWYEHSTSKKETDPKTDWGSCTANLKSAITRIENKLNEGNVKDQPENAQETLDSMKKMLAAMEA